MAVSVLHLCQARNGLLRHPNNVAMGFRSRADDSQARRERNRRAQHEFRMRRQAAEKSNRHRIELLEDTVENLSNIVVRMCDELLEAEEVSTAPRLMVRLRSCMAEALVLAESTLGCEDTQKKTRRGSAGGKGPDDVNFDGRMERTSSESSPRQQLPQTPRQAEDNMNHHSSCQIFNHDANQSIMIEDTGLLYGMFGPSVGHVQPNVNILGLESFPIRLVEATLLCASSVLRGDQETSNGKLKRVFGSDISLHSRSQLLSYFQWVTGPGRNQMYRAAGMRHEHHSPIVHDDFPAELLASLRRSSSRGEESKTDSEFLTAVGVEEQLQRLGARNLDADMVEIRIYGSQAFGHNNEMPLTPGAPRLPRTGSDLSAATGLVLQLNTALLASNLVNVATCLGERPVYPRREVVQAIEASIILAQEIAP